MGIQKSSSARQGKIHNAGITLKEEKDAKKEKVTYSKKKIQIIQSGQK